MSVLNNGEILVATVGKYPAGIQPELSSPSHALVHPALSGPSTLPSRLRPALSNPSCALMPIRRSGVYLSLWSLSHVSH